MVEITPVITGWGSRLQGLPTHDADDDKHGHDDDNDEIRDDEDSNGEMYTGHYGDYGTPSKTF